MTDKPNYYAVIPANVRYDKDLSPNAKLLYGEITALCNAEGFCWATNVYFANLYDVTKRSIQLWLSQLEAKGFIRVEILRTEKDTSRKIYLSFTHEEKYTPPRKKIHEGHEEKYTPPHEENFTQNNTCFNNTINTTSNNKNISAFSPETEHIETGYTKNGTPSKKPSLPQIEKEFEQLWKLYPRKLGKKKAFDSFKKARKIKNIPYETIENGLYRYIRYLEQHETEEQYIQHGSTWFGQEKWQDDYLTIQKRKKPKNFMDLMNMEEGENIYEHGGNAQIIDHDTSYIPYP